MRLPDSRIGKEHFTFCTPVLVIVDIELRSRSKPYLLIYSLLTSFVPIAWMQAWVSGSTPARSIDEMQSTMFVSGMSIEKFAATGDALFSQGALSQPDSRLMTNQIAGPKIYPGLKPMDGWWKIIVLFQNSHHCLLFQTLVWNWPHALRLLAVTQHDVDESPIHAQLIVSAGSLMVHACTNNFPLTSGEVSNYYINWSKASFDFSIADIQE